MGNPDRVSITWNNGGKGQTVTEFEEFIPESVIIERTATLAEQILGDYSSGRLHLVYVALGGFLWAGDLGRAIRRQSPKIEMTFDTLRVMTRAVGGKPSGTVRPLAKLGKPYLIEDSNVIIVDEVVDSGLTLSYVKERIRNGVPENSTSGKVFHPGSVAVASLSDKPSVHNGSAVVEYAGFEVPNVWLVGCGMDHEEQGRELPSIYQRVAEHDRDGTTHFEPAISYNIPQTIPPNTQTN